PYSMSDVRLTPGQKLRDTKKEIVSYLVSFGIEKSEARVEADMIVESVSGMKNPRQLVCNDLPLTREQLEKMERFVAARSKRLPIQYCLGEAHFFGLKLKIRKGVFIPRTDTETLVETSLKLALPAGDKEVIRVLEIGVGSGAISVSLLKKNEAMTVIGTDISEEALCLTRENAEIHGVSGRLDLRSEGLWWTLADRFDLIVSNPPYIPESQMESLQPEIIRYEPHEALFGKDPDGLRFYRKLASTAQELFDSTGGYIVVEVGDGQATLVEGIFTDAGWVDVKTFNDVNGISRVVSASCPIRELSKA
ncbi:MAG: peptide chain release factor N(5)-glutamine methyltransferase, partial [Candidatus Obscuribacterales bacterium]|nr:peptide chain release factor N(5)-glutamine methyltransferase [Candidatus Obscuribacterales bacterium]